MSNDDLTNPSLSRRDLLSTAAAATGALVIGFACRRGSGANHSSGRCRMGRRPCRRRGQRLDCRRARRHRHDPDRADRARSGRLDVERDDGVRGTAVRLEQVRPQYASANRDAREMAPAWTLNVISGRHRPLRRWRAEFGSRDRTGTTGIPDSLYRRMRTNAASSVKDGRYYLQLAGGKRASDCCWRPRRPGEMPVEEVSSPTASSPTARRGVPPRTARLPRLLLRRPTRIPSGSVSSLPRNGD